MIERTHFFLKTFLSYFILERVAKGLRKGCERVDVSCVWEVSRRRGRCAILTQSSSYHSSTSFSSWLGCSTVGHWGPKALCLPLVPNWLEPSVHLVILLFYVHLLLLFFRLFTQVHHLIDGSVEGQYITIIPYLFFKIPHVDIFFASVSIPFTHTFYK